MTDPITHRFRSPELLQQALRHRSAGSPHNERLEFLGDALVNLLVAEALHERWPKADEGVLTRARAELVRESSLATIARHLRVDASRRQRLDFAGDECFEFDQLPADGPGLAEQTDAQRLAQRVREALERLPAEQAQVLRLSYYEDEPHARIATELGLPLGTVKSRIRLAVAQLRKLLDA